MLESAVLKYIGEEGEKTHTHTVKKAKGKMILVLVSLYRVENALDIQGTKATLTLILMGKKRLIRWRLFYKSVARL